MRRWLLLGGRGGGGGDTYVFAVDEGILLLWIGGGGVVQCCGPGPWTLPPPLHPQQHPALGGISLLPGWRRGCVDPAAECFPPTFETNRFSAVVQPKECQLCTMKVILGGEANRVLCARCANSRLSSTTGSHGSQGPEFCSLDAVLNGSCTLL